MLGIGMQEIVIILIVALIIIGPKKLPDLARALGRAMGEFRRAADDLKDNLDINGMKAEKEKLMREITQNQLNLKKKSEGDNPPPQAEEPQKENKD
jgi:Tat protein translocase TatB subunit